MTALRGARVLSLFALTPLGCAPTGSSAPTAITPPPAPVAVDPVCTALANAKTELDGLVASTGVSPGKHHPRDPIAFGAELRATATQARTVTGDEASVALGHSTADLFDGLADRARAVADAGENPPAVEAAVARSTRWFRVAGRSSIDSASDALEKGDICRRLSSKASSAAGSMASGSATRTACGGARSSPGRWRSGS